MRCAHRQRCQLHAAVPKNPSSLDKQGVGRLARKRCKGGIDLLGAARLEDLDFQPKRAAAACSACNVVSAGSGWSGLSSTADASSIGHELVQELELFRRQTRRRKQLTPVALPPGRARLATRPSLTGSSAELKTIGIVVVADLAARAAMCCRRRDHRDLAADQFGRHRRQPIIVARPAQRYSIVTFWPST